VVTTAMTRVAARLLLAPTVVIAIAILVKGYSDVGDGFNAGVIAALGVLLQYLAFGYREAERMLPVRLAPAGAIAGLMLALVVTFAPLAWGDPPLTHLPAPGADVVHLGTLELLTAVAFDIGVFLLVFGAAVGIIRTIALAAERRLP
jgi:multicomponent Na+:H+ antiporter subunit B